MVEERGYERRVATGGPVGAVLANPDDYGAGIGRALSQAGGQLHQQKLRSYRIDREEEADRETAEVARRSAEARVRMDERIRQSRTGPVAGAAGHAEAMAKALADERDALVDGIKEEVVRRRAIAQWDNYSAGVVGREGDYELGRKVGLDISNIKTARDIAVNRVVSSGGDAEVYGEELTQRYAAIDALQNVTPEEKEALKREDELALTFARLDARNAVDPAAVKLEIASGAYDELLTAEQIARLDHGAEIEIKAQVVEAEQAAQDERKAARADLETLEAKAEAGDIASPREVQAALVRGRAAGVPEAELIRWKVKQDDATILRAFGAANDPQGARSAAAVAGIDARIRAGEASPEDYRLRDTLAGYATSRAVDQGKALKSLAATGPQGQMEAVGQVVQLPSRAQRYAAGAELGGNLGHVALLPSQASRQIAITGAAVLKARPKDFGEKVDVDDVFARIVGQAAPALGGEYGALKSLAWQIYAGQMNALGRSGWDKANFATAVRSAFGATTRPNGTLQGGIGIVRGKQVLLPDNFTAGEFDAAMSRYSFDDAYYADGRQAAKADVLAWFRPELYDSDDEGWTYYRMVGPGRKPLLMKDGRTPYWFRVKR